MVARSGAQDWGRQRAIMASRLNGPAKDGIVEAKGIARFEGFSVLASADGLSAIGITDGSEGTAT
jgi:hypothetical protein